jgi:hypothetical protein
VLILCPNQAVLNILEYSIVEEEGVLLNKPQLSSPPMEISTAHRSVADGDLAIAKIVCEGIGSTKLIPS